MADFIESNFLAEQVSHARGGQGGSAGGGQGGRRGGLRLDAWGRGPGA